MVLPSTPCHSNQQEATRIPVLTDFRMLQWVAFYPRECNPISTSVPSPQSDKDAASDVVARQPSDASFQAIL